MTTWQIRASILNKKQKHKNKQEREREQMVKYAWMRFITASQFQMYKQTNKQICLRTK